MPQQAAPMGGPVRVGGAMAGAPRRPAGMAPAAPVPSAPAGFAEAQLGYAPVEAPSPEDIPASILSQNEPQRPTATRAVTAPSPASAPAPTSGGGFSLFRKATGLMRRNLGAEGDTSQAAPQAPAAPRTAAPQATPTQPAPEDMNGLDIPTFLRRQSN
jgi:hypothetical protein